MEVVDAIPPLTFILLTSMSFLHGGLQCQLMTCVCRNSNYGNYLDKKVDNTIRTIKSKKRIYKRFGKYNKCNGTISYVWGEQIICNRYNLYILSVYLKQCGPLWLDIWQDTQFDTEKCRQEYESGIYILTKIGWNIGHVLRPVMLIHLLALIDWAKRGCTAQEFHIALNVHIINHQRIISFKESS